jgi:hypothetical protein
MLTYEQIIDTLSYLLRYGDNYVWSIQTHLENPNQPAFRYHVRMAEAYIVDVLLWTR